jgi:hypothetical protein
MQSLADGAHSQNMQERMGLWEPWISRLWAQFSSDAFAKLALPCLKYLTYPSTSSYSRGQYWANERPTDIFHREAVCWVLTATRQPLPPYSLQQAAPPYV